MMNHTMLAAAMLMGIGAAGAAEPAPSPAGQWNVRDFGAKGDGQTDDTDAFQAALDAAGAAGAGTVTAPLGQYRFDGSLKVPANVTLAGSWVGLRYFPGEGVAETHRGKVGAGTRFLVYAGRGQSEDGTPFLSLTNNSVLQGVVISYPEQTPDTEPTPYPWTVFGKGDGVSVIDVCLLRAYQGVKLQVAPCHLVRNLTGSPILTGMWIDGIHDIGRVENVHFKSGAGATPEARLWAARNSQGFVIGTTDWQYMTNTFCWGYGTGYHFIPGEGIGPNGNFLGIGADRAHVAVQIDAAKFQGIAITNGEFVVGPMGEVPGRSARKQGIDGKALVDQENSNPTHVVVSETNQGSVRFSNCTFWGGANHVARVAGKGWINFGDCAFRQWGGPEAALPAFVADGGNLQVHDSQFNWNAPQFAIGPHANGTLIVNNTYTGEWRGTAPDGANVQAANNLRADSFFPGPQKIGKAAEKN